MARRPRRRVRAVQPAQRGVALVDERLLTQREPRSARVAYARMARRRGGLACVRSAGRIRKRCACPSRSPR
jgi:hypothetical protein